MSFSFCLTAIVALTLAGPVSADLIPTLNPTIRNFLCVGGSCADNETFNGGELRLNNSSVELEFIDSSTINSGFPHFDWTLQANENTSGGANQFMIKSVTAATTPVTVHGNAGANALFVASGGDVGLGTSIPQAELHIHEFDPPSIRLTHGETGSSMSMGYNSFRYFIRNDDTGNEPLIISPGAENFSFNVSQGSILANFGRGDVNFTVLGENAGTVLHADAENGRVGIGTDSPDELLHIISEADGSDAFALFEAEGSNADAAFRLKQATTNTTWEFRNQAGSGRLNVGIAGGNTPFKIDYAANTNLLRLGLNGQPGTVSITGTLTVNNQALNVPDYVFEDDYDLMPLAAVSAFIETNGHLPEVPSAGDVARDGLDVPAMQMTLLKKVEELTLHSIAMQDTIAGHEDTIAVLRAEMAALKAALR